MKPKDVAVRLGHWVRLMLGRWKADEVGLTARPRTARQQQGDRAEQQAAQFLHQQGLRLIGQNVRAGKGEIDIIALEGHLPVFVEVRYRGRNAWIHAGASIDRRKQRIFLATARKIMRDHGWLQARFDAVLADEGHELVWVKNAFQH